MAWSFDSVHELIQHPQTLKWYLRVLISNGSEQRLAELKFQTEPTQQQGQAAVVAMLQRMNESERIALKRISPPNLGELLTTPQRATLRDSLTILEETAPLVDSEIRADYTEFVAAYKERLVRYFR